MAFVLADKVREACNAPGTSDFELLGAPPSADTLTFASQIGDGNTTRYQAWGAEGWEIGIGTVSTGATNRLLRPGTVLVNSSGGTGLIDFQGAVQVACVFSTTDLPYHDENGDIPARGGRDLGTEVDPWRGLWLTGDAVLGGGVETEGLDLGRSTHYEISRKADGSFVRIRGGPSGSGAYVEVRGPNAAAVPDSGDLRDGNGTVRVRWGNTDVRANNGAGGLLPIATVSQATAHDETDFPIGHPILVASAPATARNASRVIYLANNISEYTAADDEGAPLSGTYRANGRNATSSPYVFTRRA